MRASPPRHNLKIQQPWCQSLRQGVSSVRKIFDQQIRDCVVTVNDIEYFEAGPDIIKAEKRRVAAAFAAVAVEQQSAETNISADISGYLQPVAVLGILRDIIRQVAAIDEI